MDFSSKDVDQIKSHGLTVDIVNKQIERFSTGFPFVDIVRPAALSDGVIQIPDDECRKYAKIYQKYQDSHKIVKFVPASGAATRMFKDLFDFISSNMPNKTSRMTTMNIENFAFWDELKQYLPRNATDMNIIDCLVTNSGLGYGNMPKALILFHKYSNNVRTSLEEHLCEGFEYAKSEDGVHIYFTVSPEHRNGFESLLNRIVPEYESKYGVKYDVFLSEQKESTDTIAMNMDNTLFRNEDGTLLFRPAGHGALLANLAEVEADLIFIKNVDNVSMEYLREDTIKFKQVLAGLLVDLQAKIFEFINAIDANSADITKLHEFIVNNLGVKLNAPLSLIEYKNILNRPIRVCGVVKNTGEPGGGPFWIRDPNGTISLQMVENSQISPEAKGMMSIAEYFNPVDLVCRIKDYQGKKFDLNQYVDENAGVIAEKSKNGLALRAMERPGLWNGSMAKWNTVLVEVPASTFSPVKIVTDLLLPPHQPKK